MKKLIFVALVLFAPGAWAQLPTEVLVGNKQAHYIGYWQKDIDSTGRFNLFTLSRFAIDYRDNALSSISIEGQLTYQLRSWLGVSIGGGFEGAAFVPSVGLNLSYASQQSNFFLRFIPRSSWTIFIRSTYSGSSATRHG
jgi:hypothetical protein